MAQASTGAGAETALGVGGWFAYVVLENQWLPCALPTLQGHSGEHDSDENTLPRTVMAP